MNETVNEIVNKTIVKEIYIVVILFSVICVVLKWWTELASLLMGLALITIIAIFPSKKESVTEKTK